SKIAQMDTELESVKPAELTFSREAPATLTVRMAGNWHLRHGLPSPDLVARELAAKARPQRILFESGGISGWDSGLLTFLVRVCELSRQNGVQPDLSGLPAGARKLIELAQAVPEKMGARAEVANISFATAVGQATISYARGVNDFLRFLGDVTIAFGRVFTGKARFRREDLMVLIQDCGANAFGIVTLISFLVGTILAFMGAIQLQQFGASIYIADLVGIAMTHDMGAMMTAIIMAGRTGASFAAQLGTMKVTQEIDALTTMGISPIEFLVVPRVTALFLMIPLLCLYSDFVGMVGGGFVAATMMGIGPGAYMRETWHAVTLTSVSGGVIKSMVYGVIIAVAGCLRGFECGNSSSAVGDAATQAVVTGIVYVVVACGIFAFLFNILGI
ncbi:MAG TPA: ABC transporter permease, partial [Candidatus Binataceae bacterium]|nr:ABC transporter permease [Candidatus Binataceae bacterium]